jgi:AraC family transcriptional regulator
MTLNREEEDRMDGGANRLPLEASSRVVEQSSGVQSIYRVSNADGSGVFAAKWKFDNARVNAGNMTHGILACRVSGTATLTRRSKGCCIRRRPTIGSVTYVAPDAPAFFSGDGSCEVCHVYIPEDSLRLFAETDMNGTSAPRINDMFAVEDPWLKGYFQMLSSEFEPFAERAQPADTLFVSHAEYLLIHHLLRAHSNAASRDMSALRRSQGVSALRSVALTRVQDYIAANLAGNIALPDLAAIAYMSSGHFLRAFRVAVGTTPYHYVLEQRLRRASSMLRTTTLPVSRIAMDCGFKTPSQLSSKFRARVGTSPSWYRASCRGEIPPPLAADLVSH